MSLSLDTPLSLYSIPVVWLTAFYPHNAKVRLIRRVAKYDNIHPRTQDAESLAKKGVPKATIDKITRMAGAHQNGNEMFPFWTTALLAANFAGLDQRTLNLVSAAFIGTRLLYNYIYFNQQSVGVSIVRTFTWMASLGFPMYLIVKSANKVRVGL